MSTKVTKISHKELEEEYDIYNAASKELEKVVALELARKDRDVDLFRVINDAHIEITKKAAEIARKLTV